MECTNMDRQWLISNKDSAGCGTLGFVLQLFMEPELDFCASLVGVIQRDMAVACYVSARALARSRFYYSM